MYILIVARNFPKENEPLQGIFEFDQAKALQNYGHKIVYLSLDLRSIRRKRKLGIYWTEVDEIKIFNISFPLGRIPFGFRYKIGKIALRVYFKEILKKYGKPDIIHAHFTAIGLMASILQEKYNIPIVLTEHSSHINKQHLNRHVLNMALKAYSKANRLISVSTALRNVIFKHFNLESDIIHNIVDTSEFSFIEKGKSDLISFLSVGSLNYNKGFDLLIEAFSKADFNKNIHLNIIGEGPEYKNLQQQIDKLELNDQIKLLGFSNRTSIFKLMKKSDVFVLASRSETFGVVYIEAMLSGLPVIAAASGGPEDFITPENGITVPVDDVIALRDALIKTHNEIHKYDRKNISESCRKKFSPEIIASQLTRVYIEVLNNMN